MQKAIIADDENWICQLISKIVDWDKLGINLAGIAQDGISAFELIKSVNPSIVITDIRMPGMDGLDIIKQTRELGLDTKFVIISGFKHFDYAHSAIKYGVEDYLLKPIKKQEINDVLLKIITKINEGELNIKENENLHLQIKENKKILRENFFEKVYKETQYLKKYNLEKINSEYGYSFKKGLYNCIKFKFDIIGTEKIDEAYMEVCTEKIFKTVKNHMKNITYDNQVFNQYTCIINYPAERAENIKSAIKDIFKELKKFLGIANIFSITVGVGRESETLAEIYISSKTAEDAINCRITEGINKVINYNTLDLDRLKKNISFEDEDIVALTNLIETFDFPRLKSYISAAFDRLINSREYSPLVYYDLSKEIHRIFLNSVENFRIEQKYSITETLDMSNCTTINAVKEYIIDLIFNDLTVIKETLDVQAFGPVRAAKKFIHENYNQKISLSDLAELVNLNPVYFSIIFKKETGQNFSDYLVNFRINKAKELLKNIKYNISQVAEMVGYSDPKYFSKVFKKIVGINPIQFRKIHY